MPLQGFIRIQPICDAKVLKGFLDTKQSQIDTFRRRYGALDITSKAQKRLPQWSWLPPWGFTCSACQARKSDVLPAELSCSRSGQQIHTDKDHQKTRKQLLAKQSSWTSTIVNATKYTQWTSAYLRLPCMRTFFRPQISQVPFCYFAHFSSTRASATKFWRPKILIEWGSSQYFRNKLARLGGFITNLIG